MPAFVPALLLALTDATAAATATSSVVASAAPGGGSALALASVEGSAMFASRFSRAALLLLASARHGRALAASLRAPTTRDLAATARARLDLVTSPRTNVSFSGDGLLASRLGLRAATDLAARDPFLQGRVIYNLGSRIGFSAITAPRSTLRLEAGYAQAGAVAADHPDAVGLDSHAFMASVSGSWQSTRSLRFGPVLRTNFTHFEHALLDVDLTRGRADVTTVSALVTATLDLSRSLVGAASFGSTVASPPTFLRDASALIAPEARIDARYAGKHVRVVGSYGYA